MIELNVRESSTPSAAAKLASSGNEAAGPYADEIHIGIRGASHQGDIKLTAYKVSFFRDDRA